MKIISSIKVHSGLLNRIQHESYSTNSLMTFSIFLPSLHKTTKVPVLYWLSGLTCNDENFCQKSGAFQYAEENNIAIVCPDTSPRGLSLPCEDDSWDFGSGAGFYVDALEEPWNKNYNMYSYISEELPKYIEKEFNVSSEKSISGHSMGGHGAIICALRNPGAYKSVSAFAPILNPISCEWGKKAFSNYLGKDKKNWTRYDSLELLKISTKKQPILIDQGTKDEFSYQLNHKKFMDMANHLDYPVNYRVHNGYDHSYYFISTYIKEHIIYHSSKLSD